jgi:hypothetical protein
MLSTGINGPLNIVTGSYQTAFDLAALAAIIAVGIMIFIRNSASAKPPQIHRLLTLLSVRTSGFAQHDSALWRLSGYVQLYSILACQYGASDVVISTLPASTWGWFSWATWPSPGWERACVIRPCCWSASC